MAKVGEDNLESLLVNVSLCGLIISSILFWFWSINKNIKEAYKWKISIWDETICNWFRIIDYFQLLVAIFGFLIYNKLSFFKEFIKILIPAGDATLWLEGFLGGILLTANLLTIITQKNNFYVYLKEKIILV